MSDNYQPDNDATAGDPWNTAFLSDRDVSGQVPINYVTHPGVWLTAACFPNGVYEDTVFAECFSNLLASEFRRFIIDVYWDARNKRFRLCPVELPTAGPDATAEALATSQTPTSGANTSSHSSTRQVTSNSTMATTISGQNNTNGSFVSTTSAAPAATSISPLGSLSYQIGPYQCTDTLGFNTVMSILSQYIVQSAFKIQARLQFIIVNLHAASTISDPTGPRQNLSESELPSPSQLTKNYFAQFGKGIYTPVELQNDRKNINNSWLQTKTMYLPLLNYFTTTKLSNGDLSTPDGWPNENYVQLGQGNRLLIGYGTVASQFEGYNVEADNTTMFMPGVLQVEQPVTLDSIGNVISGCLYNNATHQVDQLNASWAVASLINIDQSILGFVADNLSSCGISPMLNYTLDSKPASIDYAPYQNFGNQALFSWASGEPKNTTTPGQTGGDPRWACAIMTSTEDYQGHWRVSDCGKKHRAACREANEPYSWHISDAAVPFSAGSGICTGNTTFDVPRTGLENLYLFHYVQSVALREDDPSILDGIWLNFNDLRTDSCWVTTGPNGTCPYLEDEAEVHHRTVVVPTIAAFIVVFLTILTMLVKCNTNRRKSKVRKRGEGGWDYEGVPS